MTRQFIKGLKSWGQRTLRVARGWEVSASPQPRSGRRRAAGVAAAGKPRGSGPPPLHGTVGGGGPGGHARWGVRLGLGGRLQGTERMQQAAGDINAKVSPRYLAALVMVALVRAQGQPLPGQPGGNTCSGGGTTEVAGTRRVSQQRCHVYRVTRPTIDVEAHSAMTPCGRARLRRGLQNAASALRPASSSPDDTLMCEEHPSSLRCQ